MSNGPYSVNSDMIKEVASSVRAAHIARGLVRLCREKAWKRGGTSRFSKATCQHLSEDLAVLPKPNYGDPWRNCGQSSHTIVKPINVKSIAPDYPVAFAFMSI